MMPKTLLLADDSVTIQKVVGISFANEDVRIVTVDNGDDAVLRAREIRPDLVLADVVMPGPSGYELCRAIKQSSRPVPVLLLAGTFEPFDAGQARDCGSDGHVTKPFDSRQLVERVERLLSLGGSAALPDAGGVATPADDLEAMFDDLAVPASNLDRSPVDRQAAGGSPEPEAIEPATGTPTLSPADIDAIAARVVERLSERVLREIAWDVVPDLADIIVRERIRELERDERETS